MYQTHSPQQEKQLMTTELTVQGLACEIHTLEDLAKKGCLQNYFVLSELYDSKHRLEQIIALSEAQNLSH